MREIVLDVWNQREQEVNRHQVRLRRQMDDLEGKKDRLLSAFLYEGVIDRATFERQRDKVEQDLALVRLELHETTIEELDIEGLLAFAEHLLSNASRLWTKLDLDQKRRFQRALLPAGPKFDG